MREYKITYVVDGEAVYTDSVTLLPSEAKILENELGLVVEEKQAKAYFFCFLQNFAKK